MDCKIAFLPVLAWIYSININFVERKLIVSSFPYTKIGVADTECTLHPNKVNRHVKNTLLKMEYKYIAIENNSAVQNLKRLRFKQNTKATTTL